MKKLAFTALFASLCLLAQPPGGRRGPMMGFGPGPMGPGGLEMRSPVTGAPYSAVEVTTEQQALAGGNAIQRQTTRTIYRDGQGRVRVESQVTRPGADGQTATVTRITISDPVAGQIYEIDPQNKVVNSRAVRPMGAQGAMRPRNPNSAGQVAGRGPGMRANRTADPNVKAEDLGTQTVNSVIAKGNRTTHTIPAGTIGNSLPIQSVRETWMAADLKVPVMEKTTDPRFGTRTTQLTQINRGEPDASLFQVPAGYTVHQGGPGGRGPRPGGPIN
ncbi:MAG: hypothetical protein P4L56_10890 [Candidatus Sulfopaludibacter sp.]|nr:hypothetical protein [Candidatus Sulfopaludibacter sp.]